MTSFKMSVRDDYAISACSPLHLSIKALASCFSWGWRGGESLPLERHLPSLPPTPWWLASKIKQTFLSINLASSLAFQLWAVGPPTLGNSCNYPRFWFLKSNEKRNHGTERWSPLSCPKWTVVSLLVQSHTHVQSSQGQSSDLAEGTRRSKFRFMCGAPELDF